MASSERKEGSQSPSVLFSKFGVAGRGLYSAFQLCVWDRRRRLWALSTAHAFPTAATNPAFRFPALWLGIVAFETLLTSPMRVPHVLFMDLAKVISVVIFTLKWVLSSIAFGVIAWE
jgi:hypothetical protein